MRFRGLSRIGIDRGSELSLVKKPQFIWGMIERRENSPTVDMLERIAKALQVDPSILLARKD